MSIEDLRVAEAAINATLTDQGRPISAGTLISTLTGQGVSEEVTRVALWDLIDRGEVTLTAERKLDLPAGARTRRSA
jgi:DNA-binding transcriptional regulator PaaX